MLIPIKKIITESFLDSLNQYTHNLNNSKLNVSDSQMNHPSQKFNPVDPATKLSIITNGKSDPKLFNDMLLTKNMRRMQTGRIHNIQDNIHARLELANNVTNQQNIK